MEKIKTKIIKRKEENLKKKPYNYYLQKGKIKIKNTAMKMKQSKMLLKLKIGHC